MSGIYLVHRMEQMGLKVKVFEAGSQVGGTWYWNRYPGARFDSESYSYAYSWCPEILKEWDWSEHFSAQPETERYINFVADRYDLRKNIQFNTRISKIHWQEGANEKFWKFVDESGKEYTARFFVSCMGILTQPTLPNIPGVEDFRGLAHHTSRWPKDVVSFEGKRVAVIGTGATGIQTIQEVAKTVGHLTVFQRTPNWTAPMRNAKISKEEMDEIRDNYKDIFQACMDTPTCFIHRPLNKATTDVSEEEREALWEELYGSRGFGIWLSNYKDILKDKEANDLMCNFAARKIRQRVKDPKIADMLTPKNHGFGTRRLPLETNYLEVYNQSNVRLVDINEDPIERITEKGIKTKNEDFEFDMIVYATGFDAVTGAFDAIDIRGVGGQSLKELWSHGPQTYLGLTLHGFPNMGMLIPSAA